METQLDPWRRPGYWRATKKFYQTPEIDAISRRENRRVGVGARYGQSGINCAFQCGPFRHCVEPIYEAVLRYLSANTES